MENLINLLEKYKIWMHFSNFSGTVVWLENGIYLKERFSSLCSKIFRKYSYKKVELPYIVPKDIYEKQFDHFSGLLKYTFSVFAKNKFSGYLRTTSETPFTFLFKNSNTKEKFPILFFQEVVVFRNELNHNPPIRAVEINPFIESYSALQTEEKAEHTINNEVKIYSQILDDLNLVYIISIRPQYDTFPEASYTIAFDAILPDGKVSQVATVHNLGNSFAKAFKWEVEGKYPIQTSTGISGRALAVCLLCYCIDNKFFLPKDLIIDIQSKINYFDNDKGTIESVAKSLSKKITYVNNIGKTSNINNRIISFPLINSEETLIKIKQFIPPHYNCLGFAYPLRKCGDPCVLTNKKEAFLCYAGNSL